MDFLQNLTNILGGAGGQSGSGGSGLDALSQLSSMFGQSAGRQNHDAPPPPSRMGATTGGRGPAANPGAGGGLGDLLGGLLGSGALTGILGSLFSGGSDAGNIGAGLSALLSGGTERVEQYRDRIGASNMASDSSYGKSSSSPAEQAERLIRALIYAAKADGHIDAQEQQALQKQFSAMDLGPNGQALVNKIVSESLDPARIARGVRNADEAMQIFSISCAAINIDQFMEKNYLETLAKELGVPDDVRDAIMSNTRPRR